MKHGTPSQANRGPKNPSRSQRIIAGIDDVNRHPVIHTWSYKLAEAA
jgi:hypothetical protein